MLADNVWNKVVKIHRSQEVLKMLILYNVVIPHANGRGSDLPFETALQEYLQFPYETYPALC
jgi:hypothetical protein